MVRFGFICIAVIIVLLVIVALYRQRRVHQRAHQRAAHSKVDPEADTQTIEKDVVCVTLLDGKRATTPNNQFQAGEATTPGGYCEIDIDTTTDPTGSKPVDFTDSPAPLSPTLPPRNPSSESVPGLGAHFYAEIEADETEIDADDTTVSSGAAIYDMATKGEKDSGMGPLYDMATTDQNNTASSGAALYDLASQDQKATGDGAYDMPSMARASSGLLALYDTRTLAGVSGAAVNKETNEYDMAMPQEQSGVMEPIYNLASGLPASSTIDSIQEADGDPAADSTGSSQPQVGIGTLRRTVKTWLTPGDVDIKDDVDDEVNTTGTLRNVCPNTSTHR